MKLKNASASIVRTAGRASMAYMFIRASSDVFRDPARATGTASPFLGRVRERSPIPIPADRDLVRFNAAAQVVTGAMIAVNAATSWAAAGLAGSMVLTTLAGHAYWEFEDPQVRRTQQLQFNKNLAMIGGLLLLVAEFG
jgi:putative oxidoreductase